MAAERDEFLARGRYQRRPSLERAGPRTMSAELRINFQPGKIDAYQQVIDSGVAMPGLTRFV